MSDTGEKLYLATNSGINNVLNKLIELEESLEQESGNGDGNVSVYQSITLANATINYTKIYSYGSGQSYMSNIAVLNGEYYILVTEGYYSNSPKFYKYSNKKWVLVTTPSCYYPNYRLIVHNGLIYFTASNSTSSSSTAYVYTFDGTTVNRLCTKPTQWTNPFVLDGNIYTIYYNSNTLYFYKFNNSSTMTAIWSGAYYSNIYYDCVIPTYDGKAYLFDSYANGSTGTMGILVFDKTSATFVAYKTMLNCPMSNSSSYLSGFVLSPNKLLQNNKAIMFGYYYRSTSSSTYDICYEIDLDTFEFVPISYVNKYFAWENGIQFFNGIPCYFNQTGKHNDDDYEYELLTLCNTLNHYLPQNSKIYFETGYIQETQLDEFVSIVCDGNGVPAMNYYIRTY